MVRWGKGKAQKILVRGRNTQTHIHADTDTQSNMLLEKYLFHEKMDSRVEMFPNDFFFFFAKCCLVKSTVNSRLAAATMTI